VTLKLIRRNQERDGVKYRARPGTLIRALGYISDHKQTSNDGRLAVEAKCGDYSMMTRPLCPCLLVEGVKRSAARPQVL